MNKQDKKKYAALSYALASTRGVLHDVIKGCFDKDEVERIYKGTSLENILTTIEGKDDDEKMDWNNFLTEDEKQKIIGR